MDMVYMYSGMVGYRSFVACTCTCTCTCMNCALRLCALFSTHILIAHSCMNVHVHVRGVSLAAIRQVANHFACP